MTEVDLSWFVPLEKQAAFLECTEREACYAGGFGSGKTLVGGFKALSYCLQYPGTEGLIGRQSYRALEDTTKKVVLQGDDLPPIIPPALIARESKLENRVELVNGSSIIFRSFQDFAIEKLRSLNLGWFWLDEASESTATVWSELMARLRRPNSPRCGFATSNPNGHDWMWRRFHEDSGQAHGVMFHAPTDENVHLSPDYLAWMDAQPAEWQKRYRFASFDTASGQIFEEWSSRIHVVPDFDVPESWGRIESIDYGERNPTCWLLGRIDNDGNVWITNEYYQAGLRTSVHIEAIGSLREHLGCPRRERPVCDPSMFATRLEGVSPADAYRKAGITLRPGINNRKVTFDRVAEYLHPRPDEFFPELHPLAGQPGAPRVFVMRRCENLIREMPEYLWKDYTAAVAETREAPEEPRKLNDHAVDAFRYLIAEQPKIVVRATEYREPPKPERRRAQTAGVRNRTF